MIARATRIVGATATIAVVSAVVIAVTGAATTTERRSPAPAAPYADAVADWIALAVPPGDEQAATTLIAHVLPGWTRDAFGNLVARRGHGAPRRVVACGLDDQAFVVSEITGAGYIRLSSPGRLRKSPLWDDFHQGQRVRILSAAGARPAVVAVRSVHLWRQRADDDAMPHIDDLWVDAGARSAADVAAMGIRVLDPVVREWPSTRYADVVAGPVAGARAGCAAVAASVVSGRTPRHGETVWVIGVQHTFGDAGLSAAVAALGHVDSLVLVEPDAIRDSSSLDSAARDTAAVRRRSLPTPAATPLGAAHVGATIALAPRVTFRGTLVESIRDSVIAALVDAVAIASGVADAGSTPASGVASAIASAIALAGVPGPPPAAPVSDSLSAVATLLGRLTDTYGASGHEEAVRAVVRAEIADRYTPRVDSAGNLILALGPDRDTTVVIAHLDELGFSVVRITHDGHLVLAPLGGFYPRLWQGQPALLHAGEHTLSGIFVPRPVGPADPTPTVIAWFGVDSASLIRQIGATSGLWVTGVKRATRLGATRFSARSIDDRAGCTALIRALATIDPARLDHKVIFVWSVREETGLDGAAAVGAEFGPTVHRVLAVDTFVSSDSPLESPRFALAPIGAGAVVRALDNSSVTPRAEVDRVRRIADAAGIPLQVGTTNGGNDGSALVRYGAVDVPLAWPLRYSHSPAELIDLADVDALGRLVAAVATDGGP